MNWLKTHYLQAMSLLLAGYFFYVFHIFVGFPPVTELTSTTTTYLVLSIFFFLIPFAKKIKIGELLEYEAKVEKVKDEVKEFKDETRQMFSMQNALINTVSNTINHNVHINLPGLNEAIEVKEKLNKVINDPEQPGQIEDQIERFLASGGSDLNYALAKLRMDIERELRRILGKRTKTTEPALMNRKFLSPRSLFVEFTVVYPKYKEMYGSFDYILKVCNAAVHGQVVSQNHAREALDMGIRILNELEKVRNTDS